MSFDARDNMLIDGDDDYGPPPGEQAAVYASNAQVLDFNASDSGSEDSDKELDAEDMVNGYVLVWTPRLTASWYILFDSRYDFRTRSDCVQRQIEAWDHVLGALVNAYPLWQADGPLASSPLNSPWQFEVVSFQGKDYPNLNTQVCTYPCLSGIGKRQINYEEDAPSGIVLLARNGVLGATPENPTLGFMFELLEGFRQFHRVCPRLTISGFATAIQHMHRVSFHQSV
jgi:hypothetical protein